MRLEQELPAPKTTVGTKLLSDRELTVVRYLASRLTNREIAGTLVVSERTVETHVPTLPSDKG